MEAARDRECFLVSGEGYTRGGETLMRDLTEGREGNAGMANVPMVRGIAKYPRNGLKERE